MNDLVYNEGGNAFTDSLKIAEKFGKLHKDVLKAIRNIECSSDFQERNFAPSLKIRKLQNGGSKNEPYYKMTRDGFFMLAFGFNGKKAAQWKERFLMAFNAMEQIIREMQPLEGETEQIIKDQEKLRQISFQNPTEFQSFMDSCGYNVVSATRKKYKVCYTFKHKLASPRNP